MSPCWVASMCDGIQLFCNVLVICLPLLLLLKLWVRKTSSLNTYYDSLSLSLGLSLSFCWYLTVFWIWLSFVGQLSKCSLFTQMDIFICIQQPAGGTDELTDKDRACESERDGRHKVNSSLANNCDFRFSMTMRPWFWGFLQE